MAEVDEHDVYFTEVMTEIMKDLVPQSRNLVMVSKGVISTYSLALNQWKKLTRLESPYVRYFIGYHGRLMAQKVDTPKKPFVELWGEPDFNKFRLTGVAVNSLNTLVNSENPNFIVLLSRKELEANLRFVTEVSIRSLASKKLLRRYFIADCDRFRYSAFKGDFVITVDARHLTVIDVKNHFIYQTSIYFDYENSEIVRIQVQRKDPSIWWVILYLNIRDKGIRAEIKICKPESASKNTRLTADLPKRNGETISNSTKFVWERGNMRLFKPKFGLIIWARQQQVILVCDEEVHFFEVFSGSKTCSLR